MNKILKTAKDVHDYVLKKRWKYCVIGGLALQRWGMPRQTIDVDITLLTGFGKEEQYARALLDKFSGRIKNPLPFAIERRVLLVKTDDGIPVDIAFGGLPFEERVVKRATFFVFAPGVRIITCSAEDLIVLKAFADRSQDWVDIENVVACKRKKLDWKLILNEIRPLAKLKEKPDIVTKLTKLRDHENR